MGKHICIFLRLVAYEIYGLLRRCACMLVSSSNLDEMLVYECNL
jgi:hypothetical protein